MDGEMGGVDREDLTDLVRDSREDGDALARLMTLLSEELHQIAVARLGGERSDHTLRATALVNEAYLRLVGSDIEWNSRVHFLATAARTMRRVLVDYARARNTEKRGGSLERVGLEDAADLGTGPDTDLLDLDEALRALAERDARKAEAVELHYFAGLTHPEIAEVLEVSPATVDRELRFSRAWLREYLAG